MVLGRPSGLSTVMEKSLDAGERIDDRLLVVADLVIPHDDVAGDKAARCQLGGRRGDQQQHGGTLGIAYPQNLAPAGSAVRCLHPDVGGLAHAQSLRRSNPAPKNFSSPPTVTRWSLSAPTWPTSSTTGDGPPWSWRRRQCRPGLWAPRVPDHLLLVGHELYLGYDAGEWGGAIVSLHAPTGSWRSHRPRAVGMSRCDPVTSLVASRRPSLGYDEDGPPGRPQGSCGAGPRQRHGHGGDGAAYGRRSSERPGGAGRGWVARRTPR